MNTVIDSWGQGYIPKTEDKLEYIMCFNILFTEHLFELANIKSDLVLRQQIARHISVLLLSTKD